MDEAQLYINRNFNYLVTTPSPTNPPTPSDGSDLKNCDFNADFCGWEGNNWNRTDGAFSKYYNKYGPKSDWNSVSGKPGHILILKFQNKKLIIL
jgi:hypothetical protein